MESMRPDRIRCQFHGVWGWWVPHGIGHRTAWWLFHPDLDSLPTPDPGANCLQGGPCEKEATCFYVAPTTGSTSSGRRVVWNEESFSLRRCFASCGGHLVSDSCVEVTREEWLMMTVHET